jgi:hypothetical protein
LKAYFDAAAENIQRAEHALSLQEPAAAQTALQHTESQLQFIEQKLKSKLSTRRTREGEPSAKP